MCLDVTVIEVDPGAERLETLEMKIDRPGADGASARQRNPGMAETGQQGAEHQNRCPHRPYQVVWRLDTFNIGRIDLEPVTFAHDPGADNFQQPGGRIDITQRRHIFQPMDARGEQGCKEQGQGSVLGAADLYFTLQTVPAMYYDFIHVQLLLIPVTTLGMPA